MVLAGYSKKSQTATEYLIILAVVIVIALVVASLLGGFPGIGGGVSENAARTRLRTLEIGINAYAMTSRATMFRMQNNNAFPIQIDTMTIEGKKCSLYPNRQRLDPGQEREIICFGVVGNERGARFSKQFTITFTDLRTNALYTLDQETPIVGQMVGGTRLHTGQQSCYDGSLTMDGPVPCNSSHFGQDGYVDGTPKKFTLLSGNTVVKDEHTGLYWSNASSGTGTRQAAFDYCNTLNTESHGGFSDWRVPNAIEFVTVLGSSTSIGNNPSPNGNFWPAASFPGIIYWTSTETNGVFF
ncbi:MAG: DUF1566 domain-containing protein [Candidatus Woesearchaeota archaeon]